MRRIYRLLIYLVRFGKNVSVYILMTADGVGLIQNESQEAIDLVKDMVVSYIDRPNTLILVAMPITGEYHFTSLTY